MREITRVRPLGNITKVWSGLSRASAAVVGRLLASSSSADANISFILELESAPAPDSDLRNVHAYLRDLGVPLPDS